MWSSTLNQELPAPQIGPRALLVTHAFPPSLKQICNTHLLAEKWLLAPSRRIGLQWVESVARDGQPAVNVRVKTFHSLARDLVNPQLVNGKASVVSKQGASIFVLDILRRAQDRLTYFRGAHVESLAAAVTRTLHTLRMSNVSVDDLKPEQFESPAKFEDVRLLLGMFNVELGNRQLADEAELLRMATAHLSASEPYASIEVGQESGQKQFDFASSVSEQPQPLLLAPIDIAQFELEHQLIAAWPKESYFEFTHSPTGSGPQTRFTDRERLQFITAPHEAPPPSNDGTARIATAIGEKNEVRNIFRYVVENKIALDDVEILHTSTSTFVPLITESAKSLRQPTRGDVEDGPRKQKSRTGEAEANLITLAEGHPCSMSRPGRALSMWLDWIAEDFPQSGLMQMLRSNLLRFPTNKDARQRVSRSGLVRAFQCTPIGFGRNRYLSAIDTRIDSLTTELNKPPQSDDDDIGHQRERLARQLAAMQEVRCLVTDLFACDHLSEAESRSAKMLEGALRFLRHLAPNSTVTDRKSAAQLRHAIDETAFWVATAKLDDNFDAHAWLRQLPATIRVGGGAPQPGRVHVAHINSGGHTGRKHTFILGLNDSRFPGVGLQDPVLLDHERDRLSPNLPTATKRHEQLIKDFSDLMGRLRGTVTLSFSRQPLTSDQEAFPSFVLLSAFRLLTGKADADHSAFQEWLVEQSPQQSLPPTRESEAVDEPDWLAWRLCRPVVPGHANEFTRSRFPNLAFGQQATQRRKTPTFTHYDGFVPEASIELSPAGPDKPVMSASRLQLLGRCPLAYFFKQGLGLTLPSDVSVESHRWLDPLAMGSLLHELFEDFLRELSDKTLIPEPERDRARVHELLDAKIEAFKQVKLPPSDNVFRRERLRLVEIAETFLLEESAYCRNHNCRPEFFEASLGMHAEDGTPATILDCSEPVPITLPSGRQIHMRGRIDRIDCFQTSGPVQTFAIWDYKTGSNRGYDQRDPFKQGRVLQPYLYVAMVSHRLSSPSIQTELGGGEALVTHFGFFFPGVQAAGARLQWGTLDLAGGGAVIDLLCDSAEAGEFPATDEEHDCGICDYQVVCRDTKQVCLKTSRLLDKASVTLASLRDLRR